MTWEKRVHEVQGLRINYVVVGQGPAVILVHGGVASHVAWWENIGPLSERYTVYAPDLPAHGDSEAPSGSPPHEVFAAPAFLLNFMDALGIEQASLIGNSGGGSIAAMFAIHHPKRVDRLVMVGAGGLGRPVSWFVRIASIPLVGELLHLHTINSDRALIASIFHKPRPLDPEVARQLREARNKWDTRMTVVKAIRSGINIFGAKKETLLLDQLKELRVPLLIVWGEKDDVLPVSHARKAARELPDAAVHIMRGCGHWPHMENSEEFNRVVLRFLEDPESTREALEWAKSAT